MGKRVGHLRARVLWGVAAIVAATTAGCLQNPTVTCSDGRICPPDHVCSNHGCVLQGQLDSCAGAQPKDPCTLPGGSAGQCLDGVCLPIGCGNGVVEAGEACDDGNQVGGDGCSARCDSDETCGNAFLDTAKSEGCDCGSPDYTGQRPAACDGKPNSDAPDAVCTADCQIRGCGDGQVGGLEDCDGTDLPLTQCSDVGFYQGTLGCLDSCRYDTSGCTGRCGDGTRNGPTGGSLELCDGSDLGGLDCTDFGYYYASGLACNALCGFDTSACTGYCGDGTYDSGAEACDSTEDSAALAARGLDCTDFGFYQAAGLACTTSCQIDTSGCTQYCGDGTINGSEQCDSSDLGGKNCTDFGFYYPDGLACNAGCGYDTSGCTGKCGDGTFDSGFEACDSTETGQDLSMRGEDCTKFGFYAAGGLACSTSCQFDTAGCTEYCGDLAINGGEQCDGSDLGGNDCTNFGFYAAGGLACGAGCLFDTSGCTEYCGDGAINSTTEQCDGADLGGKDCTAFGYYQSTGLTCSSGCTYDVSGCSERCGDGIVNGSEQCDGSVPAGNDCADFGFYQPAGLACSGSCAFDTAGCSEECGDNLVNGPETCDGAPQSGLSCSLDGWDAGELSCSGGCYDTFDHCRNIGFTREYSGVQSSISDVWGVGREFFAVSGYSLLHTTGGQWTKTDMSYTQTAIWGSAADDVYVVGSSYAGNFGIVHYDGVSWTRMTAPPGNQTLTAIAGSGPSNIWAVGPAASVLQYDGSNWTAVTTPIASTMDVLSVWTSGPNDVFLGTRNTIYHWNGSGWTDMAPGANAYLSIWGMASNDVYAVSQSNIYHYNGSTWSSSAPCAGVNALNAIGGMPGGPVVVAANDALGAGMICQLAGGKWLPVSSVSASYLTAVGGSSERLYVVGGNGSILGSPGAAWLDLSGPDTVPDNASTEAVWGSGADDIVAVGYDTYGNSVVYHYDGSAWSLRPVAAGYSQLRDVSGGPGWRAAVGDYGRILVSTDGVNWTDQGGNTNNYGLNAVWGDDSDIYAVGAHGTIDHRAVSGSTWNLVSPSPTTKDLNAVWGSGTTVFAVGSGGTVLEKQATGAWTTVNWGGPTTVTFTSVWGRSATDVYVFGTVDLHYDGVTWSQIGSASGPAWGAAGDLFIGQFANGVSQYVGGRILPIALPIAPFAPYDVKGTSDITWFISNDNLLTLGGRIFRPAASETNCGDFWDDDGDGLLDCADPDCSADPVCDNGGGCQPLTTVACGATVSGTNVTGSNRWPYYGAGCWVGEAEPGPEAYFQVSRPTGGTIHLALTNYTGDLDLIVPEISASGACVPDQGCLAASQTSSSSESLDLTATANTDYVVVIDSPYGNSSTFSLTATCP